GRGRMTCGTVRMACPGGILEVVLADEARQSVCEAVRFVLHPSGRDEERETVGARRPDLSGRKLERVVPGNPPEAAVPSVADHRVRQAAEFPKVLGRLRSQRLDVLEAPRAQGAHRCPWEPAHAN